LFAFNVIFLNSQAQAHGIKLTLWFEYGSTAGYEKLTPFSEAAAKNDWLLKNGDSFFGVNQGLYMYMDQSLPEVGSAFMIIASLIPSVKSGSEGT